MKLVATWGQIAADANIEMGCRIIVPPTYTRGLTQGKPFDKFFYPVTLYKFLSATKTKIICE